MRKVQRAMPCAMSGMLLFAPRRLACIVSCPAIVRPALGNYLAAESGAPPGYDFAIVEGALLIQTSQTAAASSVSSETSS